MLRRLFLLPSLVSLALLMATCGRFGRNDSETRIVHYGIALDAQPQEKSVQKEWSSFLLRIHSDTEIWAVMPAWPDSATLHPLVRALRVHEGAHMTVLFDSSAFAQSEALRDSMVVWQNEGLLDCKNLDESTNGLPIQDALIVAQHLTPLPDDDGAYSIYFLQIDPLARGRMLVRVQGDQGWADAAIERIQLLIEGEQSLHHVSTLIITDQYEHQFFYYPLSYVHFPLDSLLDRLDRGLQELSRPARIRIMAPQGIDSSMLAEIQSLKLLHDMDLLYVAAAPRDSLERAFVGKLDEDLTHVLDSNVWMPAMVLVDGPVEHPRSDMPVRQETVLFGPRDCLHPVQSGVPGMIVQISNPQFFAMAEAVWQRMWKLGHSPAQDVELSDDKTTADL